MLARAISLGVDCGGYNTKVCTASGSDTPVIFHDSNYNAAIPTFIAFRSKSGFNANSNLTLLKEETVMLTPEIGEKAIQIMNSRPIMGSGFLPYFIDLKNNFASQLAAEYVVNTSAARVNFNDYFAMYYRLLLDKVRGNEKSSEIIFTVPAYFTLNQRTELQTLLAYAGYDHSATLDDVDAVIYTYGIDKMAKYMNHQHTVLFLDLGASSSRAFAVKFQMGSSRSGHSQQPVATRLSYEIDSKNGGVHLTNRIVAYLREKLNLQDVNAAELRRLFTTGEKLKNIFSHDQEADIILPEVNGMDHSIHMTRDEYLSIAQPFIDAVISNAKKASENIKIDEIELIGGSTKIPNIVSKIEQSFNSISVRQSLDPFETVAKGTGYYIQYVNGLSMYPDIRIEEKSSIYTIDITTFNGTYNICKERQPCLDTIEVPGDTQIMMIEYKGERAREGANTPSYTMFIDDAMNGKIEMTFHHGPFFLEHARGWNKTFHQSLTTQPARNPMGTTLIFTEFFSKANIKERIEQAHLELMEFANRTLQEVSKNKSVRFFTNHTERLALIRAAENAKKWLNSKEGKSGKESEFLSRLHQLRALTEPVYNRLKENETMYDAVHMFQQTMAMAHNAIVKEWPVNKTWLPKKYYTKLEEKLYEAEKWFNESVEITKKTPSHLGRPIKADKWNEKSFELFDVYKEIEFLTEEDVNSGKEPEKMQIHPLETQEPKPEPEPVPIVAPERGKLKTLNDYYLDTMRENPAYPRYFGVRHPDETPNKSDSASSGTSSPNIKYMSMDDL